MARGADVNAAWHRHFPIVFAPCETLEPAPLQWLLDHGADPNPTVNGLRDTALDYAIGTYVRAPQRLRECIDALLTAGAATRYNAPAVLELLRGRLDRLGALLDADPALIHKRWPELDCGVSGGRLLTLRGATLLHVAAEYGRVDAAALLLERGARVDAPATVDEAGMGRQTPIFHAVTQGAQEGLQVARLLLDRGAAVALRARLPGDYEQPGEVVECNPLGYAMRFPDAGGRAVALLREHGAME